MSRAILWEIQEFNSKFHSECTLLFLINFYDLRCMTKLRYSIILNLPSLLWLIKPDQEVVRSGHSTD